MMIYIAPDLCTLIALTIDQKYISDIFGGYLANFRWFAVVWTLIYHDLRHQMVKMLWTHEA